MSTRRTSLARPQDVRSRTWMSRRLANSLLLSQEDIEFLNSMRPICAVCNRLIETMSWNRPVGDRSVVFRAECHGEVEETIVRFDELPALMSAGVQGAKAFTKPKRLK